MIAISSCKKLHDYEHAVRQAGGEPWVVGPGIAPAEDVVRSASCVLLTGGGDVDPVHYGAAPHLTYSPAEQGRDWYEIELIELALDANLPVLAVCRGLQVLNVARHGTLIQDIPTQVAGALQHRFTDTSERSAAVHQVTVEPGSLLEQLIGARLDADGTCGVNSRHHQAVRTLGQGLGVVATAPDGIVEAIEAPAYRFCLGVQWHPENFYVTGEFRELFEGFLRAGRS